LHKQTPFLQGDLDLHVLLLNENVLCSELIHVKENQKIKMLKRFSEMEILWDSTA
jgi:hypothetical protein